MIYNEPKSSVRQGAEARTAYQILLSLLGQSGQDHALCYIGPYFGSAQVFAMDYYNEYADKEQLLISKFKDFYREVEAPETTADRQAMREAAGKTK